MKKIPTLFERVFQKHRIVEVLPNVIPGMEWVLEGEGEATVKIDGSCCAIFGGELYKRYDAKKGKNPPEGAIPCCDPDPITGHHPHWVKVDANNPSDKWFIKAFEDSFWRLDGTYEAVGPHFNGNPYGLEQDILCRHGNGKVNVDRTFESIKQYLTEHAIEGLVFWKDGEPQCKIKRSDFGLPWPVPVKEENNMENALTKEEVLGMKGMPVWAVNGAGEGMYILISDNGDGVDSETGIWDIDFYGMPASYDSDDLHRMGWLAFRHAPERE